MKWSFVLGAALAAGLTIEGCVNAGAASPPPTVTVSYDGATCAPGWSALKPGTYDFAFQNRGNDVIAMTLLNASDGIAVTPTTPVTPGVRASIVARLGAGGSYAWRCQTPSQAAAMSVAIHVRGAGAATSRDAPAGVSIVQLYHPLARYTEYVSGVLGKLRGQIATLEQRLEEGNLAGARSAWLAAHLSWLTLGQDDGAYGAFGELGNRIDGTADGDIGTTSSPSFTGFHRVELDLWRRHDLAAARADTATLTKLVDSLDQRTLSQDLPDTTIALDSWVLRCHEILEDALRDSLSQNDNYGSNSDLDSVRADVTATREMLRLLAGLIEPRAPGVVETVARQLRRIDSALAASPVRTEPAALPVRTRERIDAAIGAALETLAPVSELTQISNANS